MVLLFLGPRGQAGSTVAAAAVAVQVHRASLRAAAHSHQLTLACQSNKCPLTSCTRDIHKASQRREEKELTFVGGGPLCSSERTACWLLANGH